MRAALLILVLVACHNAAPDKAKQADQIKVASLAVKKYAFEAYPMWAAAHAAKACPDDIAELNAFMNDASVAKDPWGTPYKMMCGPTLPPGAKGLAILSYGPDQKEGTADDIKSWE